MVAHFYSWGLRPHTPLGAMQCPQTPFAKKMATFKYS